MIKEIISAAGIIALFNLCASATLLPFPSTMPAVSTPYDSILLRTWEGIKKRNIDPYSIPAIHRPKSEMPHDAVSEGIGYGMLLALYCNDQTYFNKIWDAGETYMWGGEFYNWRISVDGNLMGMGAASDAEEDIALALIFADLLVQKGVWQPHSSPNGVSYAQRAQVIVNSIWSLMVQDGKYLSPGAGWGGADFVNPGYFAPAFYRVFDEFEEQDHNWSGLIDQCYTTIALSPGYEKGLIPDWIKPTGEYCGDALGYNSYANGQFLYKDAIRIYWRLATDYLWYGDVRAKAFLTKSMAFLETADRANFFQMDGSAVTDSFQLGNDISRPRTEHSHLTVGMWATAAIGAGGAQMAEPFSEELLKFYSPGSDFWGNASDPNNEDTLHNEMYFDQFLAWFGASLISGVFTNLWEDMKDPNPEIPLQMVVEASVTPYDIDANVSPLRIVAQFNKPARWTVELIHADSGNWVQFTGSSDIINITWYGLSSTGAAMPQGYYDVVISTRGMAVPVQKKVWLGRALDLRDGNRIIVDDFKDSDLNPYIGNQWGSYLDSYEGKAGKSTITSFAVEQNTSSEYELHWAYRLDGSSTLGFDPYAALEWSCTSVEDNFNLTGLDSIIIYARAASPVQVSIQIVTSDITDYNFFEDSLDLTSNLQQYRLAINDFKQRWGGSMQLDLSKIQAIRFQVQYPDGTENELVVQKMLFSGSLNNLYMSPPDYIGVSVKKQLGRSAIPFTFRVTKKAVSFRFDSKQGEEARLSIFSPSGRLICKRDVYGPNEMAWDYGDRSGSRIAPGVYMVVVENRRNRITLPLVLRH